MRYPGHPDGGTRPKGWPADEITHRRYDPIEARAPTTETKEEKSVLHVGSQVHSRIINIDCGRPQHEIPADVAHAPVFALPSNSQASHRIIINDWDLAIRTGFQPSRLRHLPAVLNTTSDGAQRSGTSIPIFLPRGITPAQALEIATTIDPFDRALDLALTKRDRSNYWRVTHEPKVAKSGRRKVIRELTKLADKLRPLQVRLQNTPKPSAPARLLHIPLITFLVKKLNYPDTALPSDLTRGMKITGAIAKSNVLAARTTPASKKLHNLRTGLSRRNRDIIRTIANVSNKTLKDKC